MKLSGLNKAIYYTTPLFNESVTRFIQRGMEIHGSDKAESESEWAELTQECLLNILSRLDLHHLWTGAMFVCKSWLRASRDPSLHATLDLEPYFNSTTESARWWLPEFEKKIDSMLQSVIDLRGGPLTEIRTRHCSDRAINLASQRCPNLLVLSIKSCPNVTDDSISRIAFRCSNLTELDISYCYQISHQSLLLIGRNCPNLKIFKRNLMNCLHPSQHLGIVPIEYLNSFPQDGDTEAAIIGNNMPNLQYLEIQFSKLSAKGLASICNGCLKLEHLDLSGCSHLSVPDIANASSKLKNLKLIIKPKSQIPETMIHAERYGHWNLYDDRFRNDVFPI